MPLIGRNINALDAHDAGGIRYYTVSFESGGSLAGISYSSSDILAHRLDPVFLAYGNSARPPTALDFGDVPPGHFAAAALTLRNLGRTVA